MGSWLCCFPGFSVDLPIIGVHLCLYCFCLGPAGSHELLCTVCSEGSLSLIAAVIKASTVSFSPVFPSHISCQSGP